MSRRGFLTATGAVGAVAAAGIGGFTIGRATAQEAAAGPAAALRPGLGGEPFHGTHQAGIATPQQDRLLFAAFDLTTTNRADLERLLRAWTDAAARLTAGLDVADPSPNPQAPPTDTGEAAGLDPAHLTLTFGFGPTLFTTAGVDRFGLASKRPAALVDMPRFPGDELDPARSGGDLCVQACSNDPQVAYHAIRNLTRLARGIAVIRWTQEGFGRTSSTTSEQTTPRNLMGFKDGTNNLRSDDPGFDDQVWVTAGDGPDWMVGGSYLVARRIRILIEVWDRSPLDDQENTIGRVKASGAPLGATLETDPVDLTATTSAGPVIPHDAHVRLANQARHRHPPAAARLLLHRRCRPPYRPARRRAVLPRLPTRSPQPVHRHAGPPRPRRRAQRIHQTRRHRSLRHPTRRRRARPLPGRRTQVRSKRSRFMTLFHAAAKSCTNFCCASSQA